MAVFFQASAAMDPGPTINFTYDTDQDGWNDNASGFRRYPLFYRSDFRLLSPTPARN